MVALQYATYQLIDVSEPEELQAGWVAANLCPFLGVRPAAGSWFTAEDEDTQAGVTMLSYRLWQRTLGLGGLVAFSVARRTREIGLRISFGATRFGLLRMFASGNLKLVVAGLMIGIPGSWAVTRYARTLLYEVTPTDPATIGLVLALLAGVSMAVAVGAALRATTIEPANILRHE